MTTTAYPLQSTLSTPAQADLSILLRDTTALRLLRLLQNWARTRIVEPARGSVWVVRHHLEGMLGVVGRTVRRALRLLEQRGWILPAVVSDAAGVERGGFIVAVTSAGGFWDSVEGANGSEIKDLDLISVRGEAVLSPDCPPLVHEMSASNIIEAKENTKLDGLRGCAHDSGGSTATDREESPQPGPSNSKPPRRKKRTRDANLWAAAKRVAAYERTRRAAHPRADLRNMMRWPLFDDSCWAIYRLMERTGSTEAQLKAAIDLTWDRAVIHESTWLHWQSTALWEGSTPGRLQGWLREPHNAKYLAKFQSAEPEKPVPARECSVERAIRHNQQMFADELLALLRAEQPPLATWTVGQAWTERDVTECVLSLLHASDICADPEDARKWSVDFLCKYAQHKASAVKA